MKQNITLKNHFFLLALGLLVLISVFILHWTYTSSKTKALAWAEISHHKLMIGDNREAIRILGNAVGTFALQVKGIDFNNQAVFSLGDHSTDSFFLFHITLSETKSGHHLPIRLLFVVDYTSVAFALFIGGILYLFLTWFFYRWIFQRIENEKKLQIKIENSLQMASLARQVAHDIRSPLAALDMMLGSSLAELPEAKRVVVRGAVERIRDIANNLVQRTPISANRSLDDVDAVGTSRVQVSAPVIPIPCVELLAVLLDSLISEKRMQFRSELGVSIEARLGAESYGLFSSVSAVDFKRVLSNLINNAVEALPMSDGRRSGQVWIELRQRERTIELLVNDNGKGIPAEVLPKLGVVGVSFGKDVASSGSGSGLGLAHARSALEAWGGQLLIESALGRGTRVILNLPSAEQPNWFASGLYVSRDEKQKIVVLDDDQSIHGIWDGRLQSVLGADLTIRNVVHVSTPNSLRDFVRSIDSRSSTLYLCDYELLGFKDTGLDLIEELGIAQHSVLVTSRFEEEYIRARCERMGVKVIPKSMAAHVPLIIEDFSLDKNQGSRSKQSTLDAVLIDDDSLVHMIWKMAADECGKEILLCANEAEFMTRTNEIGFDTPIYIDQNLESGAKGLEVARRLFERGYSNLYLSTGDEPGALGEHAFIKKIVGKSPPWGGV